MGRVQRVRSETGTFGKHLQNFARSVDIVDSDTLDNVRDIIWEYVREELSAVYFEVSERHWVDNALGLSTSWSSENKSFTTTIKGDNGKYSTQLAVAFDTTKPLWIVNPEGKPLREADSYVDHWCGITDLPPYNPPLDRDLFTSIVVPMVRPNNYKLGVMGLHTGTLLDINEYDREELIRLADALGILISLENTHDVQTQGTRDAINELRATKRSVVFPQMVKPQIFLAFSAEADKEVVGILVDVLNEHFSSELRVAQWNRIEESGTITAQLAEEITKSRFGICYLSELLEGVGGYADNPNVIFEAGMLHTLTFLSMQERSGWFPIREQNSPQPPFDIAGERMVEVPRAPDGSLNEEKLRSMLQGRINGLLGH
jgi:hypothetical protein